MNEPKPFVVKYKARGNPNIKPGVHGRFETEKEAQLQVLKCREWFDNDFGKPNAAHVGIVVDQEALALQKQQEEDDDAINDTTLESQAIDALPMLAELLESDHGVGADEAEDMLRKHAKIITRKLAGGPASVKLMRAINQEVLAAHDKAKASRGEIDRLREENEKLRKELESKDSGKRKSGRKKEEPAVEEVEA